MNQLALSSPKITIPTIRKCPLFLFSLFWMARGVALTPPDFSLIHWDDNSGSVLEVPGTGIAQLSVVGKTRSGTLINVNNTRIPVGDDGVFQMTFIFKADKNPFEVLLIEADKTEHRISIAYEWKKPPPFISVVIQDESQQIAKKYQTDLKPEEWLSFSVANNITIYPPWRTREDRWYEQFRLHLTALLPSYGGSSYSPNLTWNPRFQLNDNFDIRGNIGAALLLAAGWERFWSLEYGARLMFYEGSYFVELGPELHTWIDRSGTHPALALGVGYAPKRRILPLVDLVVVNYAILFGAYGNVHIVKLGFGTLAF